MYVFNDKEESIENPIHIHKNVLALYAVCLGLFPVARAAVHPDGRHLRSWKRETIEWLVCELLEKLWRVEITNKLNWNARYRYRFPAWLLRLESL